MSISELAAAVGFGSDRQPVTAAIQFKYGANEQFYRDFYKLGGSVAFQYFPERITDTKTANYASKEIPGGSHPIYTFISGGERVISFDAIFCNDSDGSSSIGSGILGAAMNALFGGGGSGPSIPNNDRKDVVDIAAAVNLLSSLCYPIYDFDLVAFPPPYVVVYLPNSGLISSDGIKDSFSAILTSRTVTYEAFHRDGTPRIAVVALEFREFIQTSDTWQFVNHDDLIGNPGGRGSQYNRNHKPNV